MSSRSSDGEAEKPRGSEGKPDKVVLALRESLRRGVEGPPVDPDGLASFSPETARLIREHNARVRRNEEVKSPDSGEATGPERFIRPTKPDEPTPGR